MPNDISQLLEILLSFDGSGALDQVDALIKGFTSLDTQTKNTDKTLSDLTKSLDSITGRTLPNLKKTFNDVVQSQKAFVDMEKTKISVLRDLEQQAQKTGAALKEALSITGTNLTASIRAASSALPAIVGGALGAAVGGAVGGGAGKAVAAPISVMPSPEDVSKSQAILDKLFGPRKVEVEVDKGKISEDISDAIQVGVAEGTNRLNQELNKLNLGTPTGTPPGSPAGTPPGSPAVKVGGFTPPEETQDSLEGGKKAGYEFTKGFVEAFNKVIPDVNSTIDFIARNASKLGSVSWLVDWNKQTLELAENYKGSYQEVQKLDSVILRASQDQSDYSVFLTKSTGETEYLVKDNKVLNQTLLDQLNTIIKINEFKSKAPLPTTPIVGENPIGFYPLGPGGKPPTEELATDQKTIEQLKKELKDLGNTGEKTGTELKMSFFGVGEAITALIPVITATSIAIVVNLPKIATLLKKGFVEAVSGISSLFKGIMKAGKVAGDYIANSFASVGSSIKAVLGRILSFFAPITALLSTTFSIYGIERFSKALLKLGSETEQTQKRLSLLFSSTEDGAKAFRDIYERAQQSGISIKDLTTATEEFALIIGKKGPEAVGQFVKAAADISAYTGLTMEQTTQSIQQMWESGAAAARQFKTHGVLEMLGFQRGVEYSIGETRKKLTEAFGEETLAPFTGAADKMKSSFEGLTNTLLGFWEEFEHAVLGSGVFDWIKAALGVLVDRVSGLKKDTKDWGDITSSVGEFIVNALEGVIKAGGYAIDLFRKLKETGYALQEVYAIIASKINKFFLGALESAKEAVKSLAELYNKVIYALTGDISKLINVNTLDETIKALNQKNQKYWDDTAKEAKKAMEALVRMPSAMGEATRILDDIRIKIVQNKLEQQKLNQVLSDQKAISDANKKAEDDRWASAKTAAQKYALVVEGLSGLARLREDTAALKAELATQQALKEEFFALGLQGVRAYYDNKLQLAQKEIDAESELDRRLAEEETNPEKKAEYYRKIEEMARTSKEKQLEIEKERFDAEQKLSEQEFEAKAGWSRDKDLVLLEQERAFIEKEKEMRLAALESQADNGLISESDYASKREQIVSTSETKIAALRAKSLQIWLSNSKQTADALADAFSNLYEATGKKIKAFFYLMKAASIVSTIISTYEGAQKAFSSLAGIPLVGPALGAAAAAVVIAGGLAKVAIISSQNLAEGGVVGGTSPSTTADNIPAHLTAGEYVQPVGSVQYYGRGAMEAIRTRAIPRQMLAGFGNYSRLGVSNFALGGMVANTSKPEPKQQPINIVNLVDPNTYDQYLNSKPGQQAVLNVLSKNAYKAKLILAGD
jgi:hypothetical protein